MSANEKELREARKAERREKKATAAAEQEKKARKYRTTTAIVIVVLVIVIAAALVINSNLFYTKTTALTVGDTKYSPAEVNYFYSSTYNSIYQTLSSQLGDMTSMVLDRNTPLSEQVFPYGDDDSYTWADQIAESSKQEIIRITALYDAAVKAGRTLTDEEKATIDSYADQMKQAAASNGFADVNKFLSAYYGKGVDLKLFNRMQERIVLAGNYETELKDSFTYTPEELSTYYAEHAADFDYYYYYAYPVSHTLEAFEGLEGDALTEKAHAAAQEIVDAATDGDAFVAAVQALAGNDVVPSVTSNHAADVGPTYKDWVTDPARQSGDTTVIDSEDLSYAVYFVGFDNNDYRTVNFRHILVKAVGDEDGNYTDEALETAKGKAEQLYATWRENPTEDNFAEIARLNSEDSGSTGNGGLYEDVTKYTMVSGVNSFLFDEGHVPGDTAVVFGKSGAYAGYHVMYFVGENDRYCDTMAEDAMRSADYDAKYAEISDGYDVVEGSGIRYVQL